MPILSDNINAMFLFDNYKDSTHIHSDNCMIIQKYDYGMHMSRKEDGEVYEGSEKGNIMTLTLSVGSAEQLKPFYSRTGDHETSYFSILFSAAFDKNNTLSSCSSSIVVDGYIVGVDEMFESEPQDADQSMLITVRILVTGMAFHNDELKVSYYTR